jgi:hypothetical protein
MSLPCHHFQTIAYHFTHLGSEVPLLWPSKHSFPFFGNRLLLGRHIMLLLSSQ